MISLILIEILQIFHTLSCDTDPLINRRPKERIAKLEINTHTHGNLVYDKYGTLGNGKK